ncbi:type II toxin-antitoxin system VapC family toxin [Ornithinimicrobium panacihumi]|uniref:type II toxin-antitoxin system VapC family toxin n=1 Tax=Ornithinimicrobium panacihumi TaxID=2008449 RepID=UPI003F8A1E04
MLVDTSVWVEFLRGTGSRADRAIEAQLGSGELATTEPVLMELLAGARAGQQADNAERLLLGQRWLHVDPVLDYHAAASVYRLTRSTGHQPRSLQDCLIAAVALRHEVAVAHRDADYEHIAAATGLRVVDLR